MIEKKLQQVSVKMVETSDSVEQQMAQLKQELNELKVNYGMKCKENEQLLRENNEGKEAMNKLSYADKDNNEAKKLMEEIQKLRSLNKHRDEIIEQMDTQNKNLRDTETQLKLTQNDYELLQNQNKGLEMKVKDLQEKLESMDKTVQVYKEKAFQAEKEKESTAIEYQNKIELLSYKLLNRAETDSTNSGSGGSAQFKELLSLCKSDLDEILNRLKAQVQSDGVED